MHVLEAWPAPIDRPLLELVRALPGPLRDRGAVSSALIGRAELHGLADVVFDGWQAGGITVDERSANAARSRRAARELDHAAHLDMLRRIDTAFGERGLRAVVLKGALLAERYYPHPACRGTTDIDLLVDEADIDRATAALALVGYRPSDAPSEARFRREHHHLHYEHPHALALELHFHAYRGFGNVLRSEALIARAVPAPASLRALRVLAPDDELVYLAVHAAAHRFGRLAWLYDLKLLVAAMEDEQIESAARRARESGFARPVALAARLLERGLGVDGERLRPLARLGRLRSAAVAKLAPEPSHAMSRSATRFVYSVLLCDSRQAAFRYARDASIAYVRRHLGSER